MQDTSNRLQNLRNLHIANADGSFASAFGALSMGSILIGFVKFLGGSDIWIGVLTAFSGSPSVFGLLQIPGAVWGRRFSSYKKFVTPGGNLWRFFYVPLIFLPILPISPNLKLWILIVCVSIATAATLLVNATYNEWLAELVPPSSRGWFYSRRNAILTLFGATAALIGGITVDLFRAHGQEAIGFSVVFGTGSFFSLISLFFYYRMGETPRPVVVRQTLGETLQDLQKPLVNRNYLAVLTFLFALTFAQSFAGNFFTAFALESLKLPFTILTLAGLTQAFGTVAASPFCGFLADKYGNKPVLILFGFFLTLTPAMWLFCMPQTTGMNAAILLPASVLVGVVWAAVNLTQFNIILATSPPDERASYIGMALTVQNVAGFVSPLIGAYVMSYFRYHLGDPDHPFFAYKLLFGVTMVLRFLSIFTLLPVFEKGAIRVRTTLRDLTRITPQGFSAMRSLSRSSDVSSREAAIQKVAAHGVSMAGDELVKALHDPSPRIRRQAAMSLARLGDPSAEEALIHQLEDHPDLVEEETIDALGLVGGPHAAEAISRLLSDPRSAIRRAAVRALGRLGEPSVIPTLVQVADTADPDTRRTALQSLRALEAREAADAFSKALLSDTPSVRIAAAEGVAELRVGVARDGARKSLELYHDEASSEVAYALGAVGEDNDIPLILQTASECVSVITRRRCLLGVARLLGVERETYRLLLLDGIGRDSALLNLIRPLAKRSKRMGIALERFSAGDERGALEAAAQAAKQPILQMIARQPVDELFLVVVCYLGKA